MQPDGKYKSTYLPSLPPFRRLSLLITISSLLPQTTHVSANQYISLIGLLPFKKPSLITGWLGLHAGRKNHSLTEMGYNTRENSSDHGQNLTLVCKWWPALQHVDPRNKHFIIIIIIIINSIIISMDNQPTGTVQQGSCPTHTFSTINFPQNISHEFREIR